MAVLLPRNLTQLENEPLERGQSFATCVPSVRTPGQRLRVTQSVREQMSTTFWDANKYCPEFPDRFDSPQHAREFCSWFFTAYNHEHRHSALGWHTPASVHYGTAPEIRAARQATLDAAHVAHPQRFGGAPVAPKLPTVAWINEPEKEVIRSA